MKRLARIMAEALRRHLQEGARPVVPDAGVIFWQCFADLSAGRSFGPSGPDPITLAEIAAWAGLRRLELRPDHVAVILALDAVWLAHARAGKDRVQPGGLDVFDSLTT